MKTQKKDTEPDFAPYELTITVESRKEHVILKEIFALNVTLPVNVNKRFNYISKDEAKSVVDDIRKELTK